MKTINTIGMVLGIMSIILAWVWFGWKLPLVILMAIAGNNMERRGRDDIKE